MTLDDMRWVQQMLAAGEFEGPLLELGAGYGGATCRDVFSTTGIKYYGTDLEKSVNVDFVADFERTEDMQVFSGIAPFGSALVLNVLEHTFEPVRILDNVMSLLKPGGKCAVLTPSIWPLHNYPMDAWRILPNFYEVYASRRGLVLDRRYFDYVGYGSVENFRGAGGGYAYPLPTQNATHLNWSRLVHKVFNTCGRGGLHPSHVAIGALLRKPLS
jgi:SAM-dependent methyltransferase